jgi:DNA polymerase III subunit alpha
MKTNRYCSLHNHTEFSNLHVIDSINKADQMLDYAWKLNMSGLAFTDHDTISGAVKFLKAYQAKLKKEWDKNKPEEEFPGYEAASKELDFKVILGNEIYLSENDTCKDNAKDRHFYHYILLAKDAEGFKQIRQISSEAWKRGWSNGVMMRTPTYSTDLLNFVKGGHLICSTACLAGVPARKVLEILSYGKTPEVIDKLTIEQKKIREDLIASLDNHLTAMENLFGKGNYFIELQPNGKEGCEQNIYNKYMLEHYWGKYPFIFTTDAHYLKADLAPVHAAFLNSRSNKSRDVDEFYSYAYMMSAEEIRSYMPYVTEEQFDEMVANTNKIRNMCSYYELSQKKVIAKVEYEHFDDYAEDLEIFNDVTEEEYPDFYYYLHTEDKADKYLAELVAHGYIKHYKQEWNIKDYYSRLQEEFWTIKSVGEEIDQHMSDYFISMAKMIDIIWNKAGSIVGPARGSAGVVLINYLIGITQMNPIEMNLPYVWRFMHPSRPDLPDIDFDTESDKRAKVFIELQNYFRSIGGDVVNVCTFGTCGTKSAIKTAARGLDIDDNVVTYLTSLIPNERGFDWSLNDCFYGNGEDRKPIATFVNLMTQYDMLWKVSLSIEGLVTHLGVHASGILCLNSPLTDNGAYMKTNKNQLVTAYDLHDQEDCGLVKYDALTVSALDRIHQCLNYMLESGRMQWQGSLKDTYDRYLSPEVLDYNNEEMWNMVADGSIRSLFQFDTNMGQQGIQLVHPRSLQELAITNAVMRLMAQDGGELPLAKYAKFKTCPQLWYDEMQNAGLNDEEVAVMEKYLKDRCGVADTQEVIMQIVMEPKVSNFNMKEANKLRKTIAKKNFRDIEGVKQMFYTKGQEVGTRKQLLDYVWNVQISMSLGYSFSAIHTSGYSLIAIQEMNLAYHYPIIYWNTACLSVDSSAINQADFYNLVEDDIVDVDEVEGKKVANKMDYAKIAAALDDFKKTCKIELPDINISRLGFTPDEENNSILYGLKGITKLTDPAINEIMANRPYKSFEDFISKRNTKVMTIDKIINLIKSGAFNNLEKKSSEEIMKSFILSESDQKKRLTMQNANMLIDLDLLPHEFDYQMNVYKLTKELRKHRDKNKMWYFGDCLDIPENKIDLWRSIIKDSKIQGQTLDIDDTPNRRVIDSSAWDRFYKMQMEIVSNYIKANSSTLLETLNNRLFKDKYEHYCSGDKLKWQLDSMNFYFDGHPLTKAKSQIDIDIDRLEDIVEGKEEGFFLIKGKQIPKMHLYTIIGTVIDKDKVKGIVTIQCPDGIVNLKLYKDLFATFNTDLVNQSSFLERGTHLMVTGVKRGPTFVPKVYKNTGRKAIVKINIDSDGNFIGFEEKLDAQQNLSIEE